MEILRKKGVGIRAWRILPILTLAASLAVSDASAYVGRWTSFTNLHPVTSMVENGGYLYVGTTGGVRKIHLGTLAETDYNNLQGLTDVNIQGLTVDADNRVWAASRSGQLFRLEGNKWSGWGRSYSSQGWTINPRAFVSVGRYLVIGSEKGLSFFDRKQGLAQANLSKFGKEGPQPVTGLLQSGDTLFIATGKAVLKAAVDWDNVMSGARGVISDPKIWMPAKAGAPPESPKLPRDTLPDTLAVDTTEGRPVHLVMLDGKLIAHDTGTVLGGPLFVKALKGRDLVVEGKRYPGLRGFQVGLIAGGRLFLGYPEGLHEYASGSFPEMNPPKEFPKSNLLNIAANAGKVVAQSAQAVYALKDGNWTAVPGGDFGYPSGEMQGNELKNLIMDGSGKVYVGHWGQGVAEISPEKRRWMAGPGSCIKATVDTAFTVIRSISEPRGDEVWFTVLNLKLGVDENKHYLGHLNLRTGMVSCPETLGEGYHTHAIRILSDNVFAVASAAGLFVHRYRMAGDVANVDPANRVISGAGFDVASDMAMDNYGRLWALINERIGFVDSLADKIAASKPLKLVFPENLGARPCRVMKSDAKGGFWVGCYDGLFHLQPKAQADQLPDVERFTTDDGLLSNRIFDLSVVKENGHVWMTTENGVSLFESASQPSPSGVGDVRAYPNPFLAKHRLLVLDHIPRGASATIFSESGNAVRHFRPSQAQGSQFLWDGAYASGEKVKPGIYLYTVSAGGKSARGKIILAR